MVNGKKIAKLGTEKRAVENLAMLETLCGFPQVMMISRAGLQFEKLPKSKKISKFLEHLIRKTTTKSDAPFSK